MNQNINELLATLTGSSLPDSTVVQLFVVEHLYLTLPESAPTAAKVTKPKAVAAKPKQADPWDGVTNANAKKRAARMAAALLEHGDVTRHKEIGDARAKAVYDEHQTVVDNAVKAYDALKIGRPGQSSRASMWDAGYLVAVLGTDLLPEDVLKTCRQWALRDWTLAEVGVTSNTDIVGAVRAVRRVTTGLPWALNQIGF